MKIFITDNDGHLILVDGRGVVIELNSGGTVETTEERSRDDVPEGINLWGGREPSPSLSFEEIRAGAEGLGVYPIAANAPHIFPCKLSSKERSHIVGGAFFSSQSKAVVIKRTLALGKVGSPISITF